MDNGQRFDSETRARLFGLAALVFLSPIYLVLCHYEGSSKGFVSTCVAGVFCGAGYAKRASLKQVGLSLYLIVFFMVQLFVVTIINLPPQIPGAAMIPIAFADVLLVLWIGTFFENSRGA